VAHPLDGPRAKIRRAEKHLEEFDAQRRSWIQSNPYAILPRADGDKAKWTFRVYVDRAKVQANAEAFGLIVGDYVHSLRSALDHLAWSLVTVANKRTLSKEHKRKIAFPVVSEHPKDFWGTVTVSHLTLEQGLMLEQFQPYRAIGMEKTTPLAHLHALWNLDKHKLITPINVTLAKAEAPVFGATDARIVGEPEWDSEVALEDGTDVAWVNVKVLGANPQVNMNRFSVDVTFGESESPIQNMATLRDLATDIVENCAHFFK
jgi:hypothetical protein